MSADKIDRSLWRDPGLAPYMRIWPERKTLTLAALSQAQARHIVPAMSDLERAVLRLDQAEARIMKLGRRAAKDGELASILGDLRDALGEARSGGGTVMTYEYKIECGHTWKSSFPRTRGALVPCHRDFYPCGYRPLVDGPFAEPRYAAGHEHGYYGYPVTPVYTVWRRADGLVNCSAGAPVDHGHPYKPQDGTVDPGEGFEVLFVTDDWPAAHGRILAERVAAEMAGETP